MTAVAALVGGAVNLSGALADFVGEKPLAKRLARVEEVIATSRGIGIQHVDGGRIGAARQACCRTLSDRRWCCDARARRPVMEFASTAVRVATVDVFDPI